MLPLAEISSACFSRSLRINVNNHNPGVVFRYNGCNRLPDSSSSAGDDGNLA